MALTADAFSYDRVRLVMVEAGTLRIADQDGEADLGPAQSAVVSGEPAWNSEPPGSTGALPLTVKGHVAGVLVVHRDRGDFDQSDRSLLASFASQMSIALENARL
jgi:GAF domain-containing protein